MRSVGTTRHSAGEVAGSSPVTAPISGAGVDPTHNLIAEGATSPMLQPARGLHFGRLRAAISVVRVVAIFARKLPLAQPSVDGSYVPQIPAFERMIPVLIGCLWSKAALSRSSGPALILHQAVADRNDVPA